MTSPWSSVTHLESGFGQTTRPSRVVVQPSVALTVNVAKQRASAREAERRVATFNFNPPITSNHPLSWVDHRESRC